MQPLSRSYSFYRPTPGCTLSYKKNASNDCRTRPIETVSAREAASFCTLAIGWLPFLVIRRVPVVTGCTAWLSCGLKYTVQYKNNNNNNNNNNNDNNYNNNHTFGFFFSSEIISAVTKRLYVRIGCSNCKFSASPVF